ncbi:MAG TPA: hypothetical protein VII66_04375 [Gemmatimonadaceae bacterium]|jgi:hypothetical protein
MEPMQNFRITTKNGHHIELDLRRTPLARFECSFSDSEPNHAKSDFVRIAEGDTALEAFSTAAEGLSIRFRTGNRPDSITVVDNPSNAELVSVAEQRNILGREVTVKLNGVAQA